MIEEVNGMPYPNESYKSCMACSMKEGRLFIEDVPIDKIADAYGTPFYVYSSRAISECFNAYKEALKDIPHIISFAVKANSNLSVLSLLRRVGSGADIVSGGELFRALKAGIKPSKIVYSGVGKTASEIEYALKENILMFNVESFGELKEIARIAKEMGKVASIAMRVNPDVDPKTHPYISTGLSENKFGLSIEDAIEAYKMALSDDALKIVGISCHIGSQLTDISPFIEAFKRLFILIKRIEAIKGIRIRYIDLGGGLGVRYKDEEPPTAFEYVSKIKEALRANNSSITSAFPYTLIFEPGRSICANAGLLVTRALYVKENKGKRFLVVDAAMNDLARPSLYKAYHEIVPVAYRDSSIRYKYDIVGPICETGDFFARARLMREVHPDELLAIMSAGAYGFSMSSNYNSRPRCAEIMVNGDDFKLIRKQETYEDLIKGEFLIYD